MMRESRELPSSGGNRIQKQQLAMYAWATIVPRIRLIAPMHT